MQHHQPIEASPLRKVHHQRVRQRSRQRPPVVQVWRVHSERGFKQIESTEEACIPRGGGEK
eukprot:scaffold130946_cov35-Tisochrysis_lutea.AAC.1